jgi:CBS domain-containing protein/ribosome-associated translation inhibitor RaiA
MSSPPIITGNDDVYKVAEMLTTSGFKALPITSKNKRLIGMVSRKNLISIIQKDKNISSIGIESIMSHEPQCIDEGSNVAQARQMMRRFNERALPVTDEGGKLVGVIGVKDIARMWTEKSKESTGSLEGEKISLDIDVKSVMSDSPISIDKEGRVGEVVKLMEKHDISSIIVTDEQKPIGIVTPPDLIELLLREGEREGVYVQITGLEEEDTSVYEDLHHLIQKSMKKIGKVDKPQVLAMHFVQYHDKSDVKEYEIRARLSTQKQMYYATHEEWDLFKGVDETLESLEKMVMKEKDRRVGSRKRR